MAIEKSGIVSSVETALGLQEQIIDKLLLEQYPANLLVVYDITKIHTTLVEKLVERYRAVGWAAKQVELSDGKDYMAIY